MDKLEAFYTNLNYWDPALNRRTPPKVQNCNYKWLKNVIFWDRICKNELCSIVEANLLHITPVKNVVLITMGKETCYTNKLMIFSKFWEILRKSHDQKKLSILVPVKTGKVENGTFVTEHWFYCLCLCYHQCF